jgi:hypothetical protein
VKGRDDRSEAEAQEPYHEDAGSALIPKQNEEFGPRTVCDHVRQTHGREMNDREDLNTGL